MSRLFARCALLAALLFASLAQAEIYKWVDDQGRVHFGDRPPDKARAAVVTVTVNSYGGPASVSALGAAVSGVVMYSTKRCGYCKLARADFERRGVRYVEKDVEDSPAAQAEFARLGARGVPVILVGKSRMDGYNREHLERMLQQAGL